MSRLARPSVASLLVRFQGAGDDMGSATGFVVEAEHGTFLVTARHAVRGRHQSTDAPLHRSGRVPDTLYVAHNSDRQLGRWRWTGEALYDSAGQPRWLEHPTRRGVVDVVAVPLTDTEGVKFYGYDPVRPGTPIAYGVTSDLHVVGFPFVPSQERYYALWSRAVVASEPSDDFNGLPCFLVDSHTTAGNAGAPTIAYATGGTVTLDDGSDMELTKPRGRFIGLYTGRLSPESDLGVVWKASAVAEVVGGGCWADT